MNTKTEVRKPQDRTASPSVVMHCICRHEYQDAIHGKGNRVHNPTNKTPDKAFCCSVCGNEKAK